MFNLPCSVCSGCNSEIRRLNCISRACENGHKFACICSYAHPVFNDNWLPCCANFPCSFCCCCTHFTRHDWRWRAAMHVACRCTKNAEASRYAHMNTHTTDGHKERRRLQLKLKLYMCVCLTTQNCLANGRVVCLLLHILPWSAVAENAVDCAATAADAGSANVCCGGGGGQGAQREWRRRRRRRWNAARMHSSLCLSIVRQKFIARRARAAKMCANRTLQTCQRNVLKVPKVL